MGATAEIKERYEKLSKLTMDQNEALQLIHDAMTSKAIQDLPTEACENVLLRKPI